MTLRASTFTAIKTIRKAKARATVHGRYSLKGDEIIHALLVIGNELEDAEFFAAL